MTVVSNTIPTPARVLPRVWVGGRRYVPSGVRHFFDPHQVRVETRHHARQGVTQLNPHGTPAGSVTAWGCRQVFGGTPLPVGGSLVTNLAVVIPLKMIGETPNVVMRLA